MSRPVNQGLAQREHHESKLRSATQNGPFSHFWQPDPTRRPRGAKMPGDLGEPSCIGPLRSWHSKDKGLVAPSLPLYGLIEGSISDFFEPKSGWAETAHFRLPTPRGSWRGHISSSEKSWDLPWEEHTESSLVGLGDFCSWNTRLWLGKKPLPWQDLGLQFGQVRGLCLSPRTCMPLRKWDLGMGYGWELSPYCPEASLPQSMA